ncbi:MFS general substrate transporter [Pseudovirgaria hyperparasitica]|uniref:MFS general substrate transporter n=1 Tax=Pseudovirgaria hyperparasitica TaxID=470096 RepID=A0A6A6WD50_9PEZI|nr:MFS general substrate transporter [Pseudovirgaria hyperparasitica]KAF2759890.1 MFS general substrate transporter [Pseudovirgaria hyperparasitica]
MAAINEKSASPSSPHERDTPITSSSSTSSNPNIDESYQVYRSSAPEDISATESKRVLRKIDRRILPILVFTYLLQYLDKNGINYASAYNLQTDLHLKGQDFSWLSSIFYFGYLFAQYPSGYALQRLPIAKFLGATTLGWGIILITTPACTSFAGIATNRFLLGALEAAVNPGFVLIMSMWYTAAEQPLRLETYYCTNGIATMFGGLIGYAVGHISTGLPRWSYIFLIFGALSVTQGVATLLFLPDLPSRAPHLTPAERSIAVARVAGNRQGVKNSVFKREQALATFADPKTWLLFVMAVGAQVPNAALTSFTSIIIGSFGFDTLGTQYLQIPGGVVQFLSLIVGGVVCSHFPNTRCVAMVVANSICILGAGLLVGLPDGNKWGRLVAVWLCYFQGLGFSMSLTMVSSNVAGSTKKQITAGTLFVGYCVGNIIGPQTFRSSEKPGYHSAYIAMLVGYVVKLLCVIVLYVYMWRSNKARDREAEEKGMTREEVEKLGMEMGMQDKTELENIGFRYTL